MTNPMTAWGNLDLAPATAFAIADALERRQGLLLFTGPAGAGKTTLSAASLERFGNSRLVVPLESIRASEFRAAPSTIYEAGDLRSSEGASAAVTAAGWGVVVGVLRSGQSRGVAERLTSMGVAKPDLLRAEPVVITQRLCRRLCVSCREPTRVTGQDLGGVVSSSSVATPAFVYRERGCPECEGEGFKGWILLTEALRFDGRTEDEVSFVTQVDLHTDAMVKLWGGCTSLSEIKRVL